MQSATDDGSYKEGWSQVVRKNVPVSSSSVIAGNLANRKPAAGKRNEMKNGKGQSSVLKTVAKTRSCDMFVSRFEPSTSEAEVADSVAAKLVALDGISIKDIVCIKLKTRRQDYASFHDKVDVDGNAFSKVMDALNDEETWPAGAVFRKSWIKDFGKAQIRNGSVEGHHDSNI